MSRFIQITCPCGCQCSLTLMQNPNRHKKWVIVRALKPDQAEARAEMEAAVDADQGPSEAEEAS